MYSHKPVASDDGRRWSGRHPCKEQWPAPHFNEDLRSLQVNVGGTHDACLPIGNKKKCTDVKTIITVGTGAYIPYISLSAVKLRKYFLALAVYDPLKVSKVANCEDTVVLVVTKTKHMRDFDNRVLFFIYIIFILHMDYF